MVNAELAASGLSSGSVVVSLNGGKLRFAVADPGIIALQVNAAALPIGFTGAEASARSVWMTTAGTVPAQGRVVYSPQVALDVVTSTGSPVTVTVTVPGATTLAALATQLQTVINAALANNEITGNPVTVTTTGTRLKISAGSPILSLAIHDAGSLGFSEGKSSVRSGDRLWFVTYDYSIGSELVKLEWSTDGTTPTFTTFDLVAGASGSNPSSLLDVNGTLYFTARGRY